MLCDPKRVHRCRSGTCRGGPLRPRASFPESDEAPTLHQEVRCPLAVDHAATQILVELLLRAEGEGGINVYRAPVHSQRSIKKDTDQENKANA